VYLVGIEYELIFVLPIPVAARSKAWVCCRAVAGIAGSNPTGDMTFFFSCTVFVLSGRGLCVGLITRPEESYRVCVCVCVCVFVCDVETSTVRRSGPEFGCCTTEKQCGGTVRRSVVVQFSGQLQLHMPSETEGAL
jgi:hypothetical protein